MDEIKRISIVVPFYNEGEGVYFFYERITSIIDYIPGVVFDLLCIDDGSTDDTLQKLISISEKDSRVSVLELTRNFGKEAALTAGIDATEGDAVVIIDSDLQDPPELIIDMIKEWINGAEVVLARRIDRSTDSFFKRTTSKLFYKIYNKMSAIKLPEDVGDFRLMDRIVVDALKKLPERHRFMKGLFAWVGFDIKIVDYVRKPRKSGASKFSGWKLWNFAVEGVTSFSSLPLRIWAYIGTIGAFVSICYATFLVIVTITKGVDLPGYASLMVSILFFGSLQMISLGIIGEYIGRIYTETKNRPVYLVKRKYVQNL